MEITMVIGGMDKGGMVIGMMDTGRISVGQT